jgi:hypothetical protein
VKGNKYNSENINMKSMLGGTGVGGRCWKKGEGSLLLHFLIIVKGMIHFLIISSRE